MDDSFDDTRHTSDRDTVAGRFVITGLLSLTSSKYTYTLVWAVRAPLDATTVTMSDAVSADGVSTY